jgi:hypothetical protein
MRKHTAQHAARLTHLLRRGAERGRGEATNGREWRSGQERQRARALHGARGGRLTSCDAAAIRGKRRRQRGVNGVAVKSGKRASQRAARPTHMLRRGTERGRGEATNGREWRSGQERQRATASHSARRSRLTTCDAATSGGKERRQMGVSGDTVKSGNEQGHCAAAARSAHSLRRGAEQGARGGVNGA